MNAKQLNEEYDLIIGQWKEAENHNFNNGQKVIVYGFDGQMFAGTVLETTDKIKVELTKAFFEFDKCVDIEPKQVEYELNDYHIVSLEDYMAKSQEQLNKQQDILTKLVEI